MVEDLKNYHLEELHCSTQCHTLKTLWIVSRSVVLPLKFLADEHVILEDPLSSTGTLSSIKNLEDAYAIGDQFINDKSTDDQPGKLNVEAEVVSMVTVPIYQASSLVPPLLMWIIDLSPPKLASSTTQAPIFTSTTTTTPTTLLPPPQQQSTHESELAECVTTLEKKLSDLEQNNKNLDNTTRNLGSRVYTLELRDLPYKIDEAVRENVKDAVQIALQAPLRDRFRDLSEEDMKEMLHQRMFKTSSYKSLPEHITLYEALEASMECAHRDKFLAEKDKSRKRRRDDQDPPPPPLDSDLSKRRRHDTGASGSSQPQAPQSSAWKKSDTPDAPSSSSKQQSGPHAQQPIKKRPEWLKPIPDYERPTTPKPAWVIPTSHIPDAENNWANELASMYQALFQMEECQKMLTDQIDWANPEGDQVRIDISKHLPLSSPPGHVTIQTQFFFNKDLYYLRYGSKIQRISLTGFPAQSVGSSNTYVLDSPCLLVLIIGTSQSRQHVITSLIHIESCKSPTKSLFDVGSSRISIFTVNT
ncbi:hypothetical protein Tco_1184670 [Tanacetum coccineum]